MRKVHSIPRQLTGGADLVVLPRSEYDRLRKTFAELVDALGKIRRGEKAYREGKTRRVKSLAELRR